MTAQRQAVFWTCMLGVLALSLWVLGSMLLPFVLGMAVGYLLDPVVDRITRWGVSRGAAAGLLILGSYALAIAILLLLTPLVVEPPSAGVSPSVHPSASPIAEAALLDMYDPTQVSCPACQSRHWECTTCWQDYTGKAAVHEASGMTFRERDHSAKEVAA